MYFCFSYVSFGSPSCETGTIFIYNNKRNKENKRAKRGKPKDIYYIEK